MKPIWILSVAAVTAATLYVIWPSSASALPPKCKPLETRLSQAKKLAPILRRNVKYAQIERDQIMTDKRPFDKILDCIGHTGRGGFDKSGCRAAAEGRGIEYMSGDDLARKIKYLRKTAKQKQSILDAENKRLNDTLKEIDYVTGALDKCKQTRETERNAARQEAHTHRHKKRSAHRHTGVIRDAGRRAGGMNAAETAAAIGSVIGILNAAGVFHGHHGGGGGGGGGHQGGGGCHHC
jgi:hypothetical protein